VIVYVGSGGEGGIRTLGTGVSPYNGLANRRIRPLCHLSDVYYLSLAVVVTSAVSCLSLVIVESRQPCQTHLCWYAMHVVFRLDFGCVSKEVRCSLHVAFCVSVHFRDCSVTASVQNLPIITMRCHLRTNHFPQT